MKLRPASLSPALALAVVLAVGLALRVALALVDDGIFWPDEIFQSIEPAHQRAFGYALVPWEFVVGARSWLLPMLLAPLLRVGAALGGDQPRAYLMLVRFVFVAASLASAYGTYLLALKLRVPPARAVVGAALFVLLPPAIYFAPRALSENAAALPIVFAVALLCDEPPSFGAVIVAGSLLGLATIFRLQNALVCAAAVAWLAARAEWRRAGVLAAVLLVWALFDGGLDRLTWGSWFHSAREYLQANLVGGYSRIFGRQPASYYVRALVSSSGAAGALLLGLAAIGCVRARGVGFVVAVYLMAHSLVGHKELRFALVVLPLPCALAAVGVDVLAGRRGRLAALIGAVAVATAACAAVTLRRLTFAELGANYSRGARVIDHGGPLNRALSAAHDRADLCGLALPSDRTESGGMSWLHRRVPVYGHGDAPPASLHHYNYVISLDRDGRATLQPLGFTTCAPDPAYRWRGN